MDCYVPPSPCAHPGIPLVHPRPDRPIVGERYDRNAAMRARSATGLKAGVLCCGAEKRMAFMAKKASWFCDRWRIIGHGPA